MQGSIDSNNVDKTAFENHINVSHMFFFILPTQKEIGIYVSRVFPVHGIRLSMCLLDHVSKF